MRGLGGAGAKARQGAAANPVLTPSEFDRAIKKGAEGAYFFFGEEEYLARAYAERLKKAVCGSGGAESIDRTVLDDESYSPSRLADEIRLLPMASEKRLVEVRWVDFSRAESVEGLCSALAEVRDCPQTVVLVNATGGLFDGGDEKRPSKALQAVSEVATPVRMARETPARLAAWAARHFAAEGVEAPREVCDELVAFVGRDMTTLAGEIEKLSAYALAHGRKAVTSDDIRKVCTGTVELDSFALANAVLRGDTDAAMRALCELLARRERPEALLAQITRVFCDLYAVKTCLDAGMDKRAIASELGMHEYRVGLYISACANRGAESLARAVEKCLRADVLLKSTPIPGEVILARLAASKL
ncbi:MAG TPA: DNA polymerase III subunit delta [Bacillota bacterium]|nr:DNA polymerase III subunit delta [Clostridiales bacterium]HPT84475.1 DNA polymerase III subunit delta [Bacillota bacterium]